MSELDPRPTWRESAELLLERIPGVVSATIEGSHDWVTAVRIWYESTWPVRQVMAAVDECLIKEGARLAATRFEAVVAEPDRRAARRPRPERTPARPAVPTTSATLPRSANSQDTYLRLVGHKKEEVEPGVMGVQVWIEWQGRTFSGAATGPRAPAGALRTSALATLRALHSCLQVLCQSHNQPGLVLETVVRVTVQKTPVVVAVLTAAEKARPRLLTAAWPDEGDPGLSVIMATLHATSRSVTRWLNEPKAVDFDRATAPPYSQRIPIGTPERRLILADVAVENSPSGNLDVGVRLNGFGESVDRHRSGRADEAAQLTLGASATLEAVHELLRVGGLSERRTGELRHAGAYRLRTGEYDIVVILAEASVEGRSLQLAGAASADSGLERAAIAATLQATNPFVADRMGSVEPPDRHRQDA